MQIYVTSLLESPCKSHALKPLYINPSKVIVLIITKRSPSIKKIQTMAIPKAHYSLAVLVLLFVVVSSSQKVCNPECKAKEPFHCDNTHAFNRSGFPKNFTFGAATSAYQVYRSWLLGYRIFHYYYFVIIYPT